MVEIQVIDASCALVEQRSYGGQAFYNFAE